MDVKHDTSFFRMAAVVLLCTALAKLYSATGHAKLLAERDHLLHMDYRFLMIGVSVVEILLALLLLRNRSNVKRSLALLWLSSNFLVYHLGNYLFGFSYCPCLGRLSDALPLPRGFGESMLRVLVLYWFAMSSGIFWREWGTGQWARLAPRAFRFSPKPFGSAGPG